jgi:glucose-6-phosphate isomerase
MSLDLFSIDVTGALESPTLPAGGVAQAELDSLVARGRQAHDDLLLARARGQVGFGDLYMLGKEAMRAREASESLASRFDNVAILATGAEADVARSVLDCLAHPFHNLLPASGRAGRPRVFVVDSADPDHLGGLLEAFPIEQTLLLALSKSGSDLATLTQFAVARDVAKKRIGPGFQDHLVVVTDPRSGVLRDEALRAGIPAFDVPANVPARYSALTPVGLLPAAMAGIDVRGILGGAHGAAERTAGEDLRTNPAYLLAAVLHVLASGRGRRRHLFVAAAEGLVSTARHLGRLFEESVGAAAGEPSARRTCEALSLAGDFEFLSRRVAASRGDLAVVLLEAGKPGRDRPLPKDGAGIESLAGRNLSDLAAASSAALRRLLTEHGVPCTLVRLPGVTPQAVGALHMASMLAAAFASGLCGGEAFVAAQSRGPAILGEILRETRTPSA